MSRDAGGGSPRRSARARSAPGGPGAMPQPPEAMFWLDRTPLPGARRPLTGDAPRARRRSIQVPPSTQCPKCDSPLSPSEAACPSCGLRRAMFNRFRASASDRVPAALEKLWRDLEAQWSDPELHERFLAQVSLCGAFAFAAARYRRAARQRQSDAIAKLQLERLSRMVHAVMAVSSVRTGRARGARPYRAAIVLLVLMVVVGGVATIFLFSRRGAPARIDTAPSSLKVRRGRSLGADGKAARPFGGLRAVDRGAGGGRAAAQDEPHEAEDAGEQGSTDEGGDPAEAGDADEADQGAAADQEAPAREE